LAGRENAGRLYHWAKDRAIPADNNLSERDLRSLVIARKISFGSQAQAGAKNARDLDDDAGHLEQTLRASESDTTFEGLSRSTRQRSETKLLSTSVRDQHLLKPFAHTKGADRTKSFPR